MAKITVRRFPAQQATDAALRRVPIVRAVGSPKDVREAASVLEHERRDKGTLELARELAVSIPAIAILLWRLARDKRLKARHRLALPGVVAYLLSPIDPIPDFIPVVGSLDDALFVVIVLRWVLRSVDQSVLEEHWTGPPATLAALCAIAGAKPAKPVPVAKSDPVRHTTPDPWRGTPAG